MADKQAIYTFKPETNRYTAAGQHGDVTVFRLKHMTPVEIEAHGLTKYVRESEVLNEEKGAE